ncbi:MAG: oligosaccharide flippase family protein [Ignavibacteriaceae bacterium]|nr:oligosaccharide flippase family protein [Ignavibacteriaceae bacterium]
MHTLKKLTENVGWLIVGTIFSNIISLSITIFLIRKLPVKDFGIYSLFFGSLSVFAMFSINGILISLTRFSPELIQKKYFTFHKSIIVKLFFISLFVTFLFVLIIFIYKETIGVLLNIPNFSTYYSLFIINIFIYFQFTVSQNILIPLFEQKFLSIINVIGIIVRGLLYWIFFSFLSINLIFIIEAIGMGISTIPSLLYAYKKISVLAINSDTQIPVKEKKKYRRRIYRFALLSTASEMGEGGFSQISDYYFVSAFLGPFAMGLYAFPYKIINSIFNWIPIGRINELMRPFFINKYYERNEDNSFLKEIFNFLVKVYILLYGTIIACIISYQKLINIYVFKSKYLETQLLLIIILLFVLLRAFTFSIYMIIELKEKIEHSLYAQFFAIFNVFAVIFVLKYTGWGLIGVAFATGLSNFLRNLYMYLVMKRNTKVKLLFKNFIDTISIITIVGLSMYGVSLINNLILQIILPLIVGFITFLILYKLIKPFSETEESILFNTINKLSPKLNIFFRVFGFSQS